MYLWLPWIHFVDHADFELTGIRLPLSASTALRLKVCATTPSSLLFINTRNIPVLPWAKVGLPLKATIRSDITIAEISAEHGGICLQFQHLGGESQKVKSS